ncbi:hypothetical protein [Diaphorobacter caeni]|uniref:hypothetical protein n=1 Tax=Diaphorobacter caeni TaxID=2784387 RepID=UPI0018904EBC|nr:hypothetical protein [Diaphorobacter caeni]MBF5006983.1 hypothetical protein [Diaphorobacter caeni]
MSKLIVEKFSDAQEDINNAKDKGLPELEEEAKKQKIEMEFRAHQARVAQELAIAERIATSDLVEITEYYEGSGKGNIGAKGDEAGISIGASGEGRKVTRRVIKFYGSREVALSNKNEAPDLSDNEVSQQLL